MEREKEEGEGEREYKSLPWLRQMTRGSPGDVLMRLSPCQPLLMTFTIPVCHRNGDWLKQRQQQQQPLAAIRQRLKPTTTTTLVPPAASATQPPEPTTIKALQLHSELAAAAAAAAALNSPTLAKRTEAYSCNEESKGKERVGKLSANIIWAIGICAVCCVPPGCVTSTALVCEPFRCHQWRQLKQQKVKERNISSSKSNDTRIHSRMAARRLHKTAGRSWVHKQTHTHTHN